MLHREMLPTIGDGLSLSCPIQVTHLQPNGSTVAGDAGIGQERDRPCPQISIGGNTRDVVHPFGIGPVDSHPSKNVSHIAMNNQHGICASHLIQYSPDGVVGFEDDDDGRDSLTRCSTLQVCPHRVLGRAR